MPAFPARFSIGSVTLAPATVLAPMAGVTDTVFRRFIRNLGGCGLIMTEFTSSHGVSASLKTHKPNKTLERYLNFDAGEHPISAQLFGADPAVLGEAARVCQDLGFDILDLNFGCPVNKVVKCNGGSGLLREHVQKAHLRDDHLDGRRLLRWCREALHGEPGGGGPKARETGARNTLLWGRQRTVAGRFDAGQHFIENRAEGRHIGAGIGALCAAVRGNQHRPGGAH